MIKSMDEATNFSSAGTLWVEMNSALGRVAVARSWRRSAARTRVRLRACADEQRIRRHTLLPRCSVRPLVLAVHMALAMASSTVHAAPEAAEHEHGKSADHVVVVSAARYEQFLEDVPLSIEVLDQEALSRAQVQDIRDLAKALPNVGVRHAPARFTVTGPGNPTGRDENAGFSIRGQEGNRVLLLIDGVRQPHSYINGSNAFGRDSVSIDLLRQVEVVHGPASVLYGSDGLAGLVNFMTLEPADLLRRSPGDEQDGVGRPVGRARVSYNGEEDERAAQFTLAGRFSPTSEWLLSAGAGTGGALRNMGDNEAANLERTAPNPQSTSQHAMLAKWVMRPGARHKHIITFEHVDKHMDVDLLSSAAKPPYNAPASVTGEQAHNDMQRHRFSLQDSLYLNTPIFDHVQSTLGIQTAHSRESGVTHRLALPDRLRDVRYDEHALQGHVQAEKLLRAEAGWAQRVSYGVDLTRIQVSSFFDGSDPGNPSFVPRKYLPDTRESSAAGYLQSEIMAGSWRITPGVRYEHFDLQVLTQAGFYPPAAQPARALSGSTWVPKLGIVRKLGGEWNTYLNYAQGFRAPNAQQINGTFDSATVPAVLLANPGLRPEQSSNLEWGVRAMFDDVRLDLALFRSRYRDLIVDKKPMGGRGIPGDPALFQTVNIDRALIEGVEVRGTWTLGRIGHGLWDLPFSYGLSRGRDERTRLPLNSILPAKLSATLRYQTPTFDLALATRYTDGKAVSDLESPYLSKPATPPRVAQFTMDSAFVCDFFTEWRVRPDVRIQAALTNLGNRAYWNWSDVQGLAANAPSVAAYTQPGRQARLSLSWMF